MSTKMQALKAVVHGNHDEAIAIANLVSLEIKTKKESCETHGEYDSRHVINSIWTKCPECSRIQTEERDRKNREQEENFKVLAWQRKIGDAGIPERFMDRTLQTYKAANEGQKAALAFAIEFAENFDKVKETGRSAIFCGMPGTGKTHLSVGIGLSVMEQKNRVLFVTVQRMMRRIKESWGKDSEQNESEVIDLLVSPELLIIDEVGIQFGSEFEKNIMFEILNSRYENRMPTLLLSNLPPAQVKAFLGDRVFDRLREDGGKCIAFDWESHRGKK